MVRPLQAFLLPDERTLHGVGEIARESNILYFTRIVSPFPVILFQTDVGFAVSKLSVNLTAIFY